MKFALRSVLLVAALALASCGREPQAVTATTEGEKQDAPDLGPGVTVDENQLKRLGIELAPVSAATAHAVASGTAVVLDSASFAAAMDEVEATRTEAQSLRENADRLQRLSAEGNASSQALESARTQAAAARARLTSSEAKARAEWGAKLVDADDFDMRAVRDQLVRRRAALLRAEFPGALPADAAGLQYDVELAGAGAASNVAAKFVDVSNAPASSANGAAVTLVASKDAAHGFAPRPGARLPVTATAEGGAQHVLVPEGAAIADAGQLWCYVARADGRFDRVALSDEERIGSNYPAPALAAGDRVVVRGAPLLLSLERGAGAAAPSGDED